MSRLLLGLKTIYWRNLYTQKNWQTSIAPLRVGVGLLCNETSIPTMRLFAIDSANYIVKHDTHINNFYIDVKEKGRAFLEYKRGKDEITLLHTEIPEQLQGLGLGKIIAKEALEYVAKNNLKLNIECEFVEHFVKKYEPKYLLYTQKNEKL